MNNPQDTAGILITYFIDEKEALFILLRKDGAINRMGAASLEDADGVLCIGQTSASIFESLTASINPELLQWFGGRREDRAPKGHICKLTIGLEQNDGRELASEWEYGSDSQVPPPAVVRFVLQAIKLTDPWYAEHKQPA